MVTSCEIDMHRKYFLKEDFLAISFMVGIIDQLGAQSVLDLGSGTGRLLQYLKMLRPDIRVVGVEPVEEFREVGYANGLSADELVDGDARSLHFDDGEFDLVCEFALLHHLKDPEIAVAEMLRVSKMAIVITDMNCFAQGNMLSKKTKQLLKSFGLWWVANSIKTRGRGYERVGGSYVYSVFDNYKQIRKKCKSAHILNIKGGLIDPNNASSKDPYKTACYLSLVGVK